MKKSLIDIGTGVVLSDSIAAILRTAAPAEDAPEGATIVLKGGGHLPTEREFAELAAEVEDATAFTPLTDYVPEIASAMQTLQQQMSPPNSTPPAPDSIETDIKKGGKHKGGKGDTN